MLTRRNTLLGAAIPQSCSSGSNHEEVARSLRRPILMRCPSFSTAARCGVDALDVGTDVECPCGALGRRFRVIDEAACLYEARTIADESCHCRTVPTDR
jgi:hypothetical protein